MSSKSSKPTGQELAKLREELLRVRRDAISVVRQVENMLDLPERERAVITRSEKRLIERLTSEDD